eukprot:CAMPEP_0170144334 /NCGR_PEP_ID=MMETSP0033_2-20121228/13423_1 /TAXON_ID=195969 /ORGANISM="Dolichomastix tenuilepis, Strain CCMP3274" /LENGTH=431 /DNA_ID=CAMNT_0010380827 /DNA_START=99 /DNA_END=1394 /DNA_ORIENTATION=-
MSDDIRITTWNILCPAYKRDGGEDRRESMRDELWKTRNEGIIQELLATNSDVIFLQEYWHASEDLRAMYEGGLGELYDMRGTPRTNGRGDGLLTAVRKQTLDVVESLPILFHDCGDRVGQLLRVRSQAEPSQEMLLIHTHLLFPHTSSSTLIRLREAFKLLEFVDAYKSTRRIRPLPIVLAGDLNGTRHGRVCQFLASQGFRSALEQARAEDALNFISHRNHHGELVGVDHIFVQNPSCQVSEGESTSWQAACFAMIVVKTIDQGASTTSDAFRLFDVNQDGTVSRAEFASAIRALGLTGEGSPGLLDNEIDQLFLEADEDNSGSIDFEEFRRVFNVDESLAWEQIRRATGIWEAQEKWRPFEAVAASVMEAAAAPQCTLPSPSIDPLDLIVQDCRLRVPEMERGIWPPDFVLSDHGPVSATCRWAEVAGA